MSTDCQDGGQDCIQLETTLPHGQCSGTTESGSILHPSSDGDQEPSKNPSEVSLVRNGNPADSPDIGMVSQPQWSFV